MVSDCFFFTKTCKHPIQNIPIVTETTQKKCKMLEWWCRTAPRGQGEFQYGTSTGTVPRAGLEKCLILNLIPKVA